jgi:xanthine dehydrogenase YagT iron-sulfur-binding subunit
VRKRVKADGSLGPHCPGEVLVELDDDKRAGEDLTRRRFIETAATASGMAIGVSTLNAQSSPYSPSVGSINTPGTVHYSLTINLVRHDLSLDPRVTLLDLLRERLHLTGTKKGCDHGQCGACTVLINGERVVSCLALAVCHDGDKVTTIEGLAEGPQGERLHPVQAAFLEHDGFQCGFCTPGQICSAVAMLEEARKGAPSAVTPKISRLGPIELTEDEVRERLSGNICRCGAYPNIVAAVLAAHRGERSGARS